jgi:hypothetical protein
MVAFDLNVQLEEDDDNGLKLNIGKQMKTMVPLLAFFLASSFFTTVHAFACLLPLAHYFFCFV